MQNSELLALRKHVTLDNQQLAYVALGDPAAPPLIMVHGWLSHAGVWRNILPALVDHYYCIAVDLLGHGCSDKPADGDYSIAANARRILCLADTLHIGAFTYIGHSMGGQIGYYLAAQEAPDRIPRLISISGVARGRLSLYFNLLERPIFQFGARFPASWNGSRFLMQFRWYQMLYDRSMYYRPELNPHDPVDDQMALMPGIEIPSFRDIQAIADMNLTDLLAAIQVPTLVIFGKYDGLVPLENAYVVRQKVKNCRLVLLDECGHVPPYEQPDAVTRHICQFLAETQA